jgi:DNA helicase HerA-like ATPase
MQTFEQLGLFYLGKRYNLATRERLDDLILYDARDLVTHAVCVGMTGSGKTGLGITVIEEAAIDGIPVLAIDPKGDLSNLLLTFPALSGADFAPWIDASDDADARAAAEAGRWRRREGRRFRQTPVRGGRRPARRKADLRHSRERGWRQ